MANSKWGTKGTWRWNNGRRTHPDIPTPGVKMPKWSPTIHRFGVRHITPNKRHLGKVDITDCDPNTDFRAVMFPDDNPYVCKRCGNQILHFAQFCGRCGHPTPIDLWLRDFGRA